MSAYYTTVFVREFWQRRIDLLTTKDGSTVRYGTLVRYGTPQLLRRGTVRFFCDGTDTVRWYGTSFL